MEDLSAAAPGIGAFLAFFFLAVALWLLMRNMNARMRRMAYRERDRLAAEGGAPRPQPGASDGPPRETPGGPTPPSAGDARRAP